MKRKPKTGKLSFIPRTAKLINTLKKYWKQYEEVNAAFRHGVAKIEEEMQKELHEELLEFFYCDNEAVGIGTPADPKRMKLVRREQLEV
jgi:hypothetical protein